MTETEWKDSQLCTLSEWHISDVYVAVPPELWLGKVYHMLSNWTLYYYYYYASSLSNYQNVKDCVVRWLPIIIILFLLDYVDKISAFQLHC